MVYCQKCGKKNEDDAKFCNSCGISLSDDKTKIETGTQPMTKSRDFDRECGNECSGHRHSSFWVAFWVMILVVIIVGVMATIMLKIIETSYPTWHIPTWAISFPFWDVCPLFILLVILCFILSILVKTFRKT